MLEELVELATEKCSDQRRRLLGRVCDLYFSAETDMRTEREVELFASVVTRILKDVDVDGRAEFAERVAPDSRVPLEVVSSLSKDEIRVAAPVLGQSPVLTDEALIQVVSDCSEEHRRAVSGRARIGERVSEKLVEVGDLDTIASLAANTTASIAHADIRRISFLSNEMPSLREKLAQRSDLPSDVVQEILPLLDPAAAGKLQALINAGSDKVQEIVDQAVPELLAHRSNSSRERIAARNLVNDVKAGKLSLDAALTQTIDDEKPLKFALVLSLVSDLPENQAAHAIINVQREALALVCKAAGISTETYLRADRLRTQSVSLHAANEEDLRRAYSRIDRDSALRAMRFVKVRNSRESAKAG